MTGDAGGGFFAEFGGELGWLRFFGAIAEYRRGVLGVGVGFHFFAHTDFDVDVGAGKKAVAAAQKAVEFIEAAAVGMKLRVRAQVPFADRGGRIAGAAQGIGDGFLGERQTVNLARRIPARVEFMTEALLVASGDEPRPRRTAHGIADVAARAMHAARGEPIEVWRGNVAAALKAHVVVAKVVDDDEEDVGALVACSGGA